MDVHLLNPRKGSGPGGILPGHRGFEPQARSLTSLVEEPERYGIRQKTGELRSFQTVYAQEKAFTYQDTVVLPAGRPDAVELLRTGHSAPAQRHGSSAVSWCSKERRCCSCCAGGRTEPVYRGIPPAYSQIMDAGEDR